MFSLTEGHRYWLWSQPTDMRKNFYSLAAIVANGMKRDAADGDVYVFINRSRRGGNKAEAPAVEAPAAEAPAETKE